MNRFRTKKKVLKDDHISIGRPSIDEPPPSSHSGFFRRGKKTSEDEIKEEEIDLSNALPPSDDFRTSLLMTGLSARFSMLREQDDPSTKIGKASDDSVLYPKRQSRTLAAALDDIAEVESIRAPPPFLRAGSFTSDTDSTHGSIMNRNRPGEGNVLFGGRQKIYRIPAGGGAKPGAGGGMGGRALYDDDVALSAFQKFKQREKDRLAMLDGDDVESSDLKQEQKGQKESEELDISLSLAPTDTFDSSFLNRSDSPSPVGYNLRRETSSTTSSAARNSTAATSVVSQPTNSVKDGPQSAGQVANSATAERTSSTTRSRRLYEQGLNQDLHEHQSSAFSRIDTLTGKRLLGSRTPEFAQSPSPQTTTFNSSSLVNPARQVLTRGSAPNLRSVSPPATIASPGLSINSANSGDGSAFTSLAGAAEAAGNGPVSPPLSPPISESSEFSILAIQPNDRGKATAMGVFQKPSLPYDESRFAQRQLQLQHGRETPTQRIRAESNASTGLSSRSSSVARQPQQASEPKITPAPANAPSVGPLGLSVRERLKTFLLSDDDDEDDANSTVPSRQPSTVRSPPWMQKSSGDVHPALRAATTPKSAPTSAPTSATTTAPPTKLFEPPMVSVEDAELMAPSPIIDTFADSPTLGPTSGLSGMVRQHLRSTSVASSVYSTMPAQTGNEDGPGGETDVNATPGFGTGSNAWDNSPRPPVSAHSPQSDAPSTLRLSAQTEDNGEDDFASQLADAKRRVHERLTTYVESDSSRTTSPLLVPTEPPMPVSKSNPLGIGILKGKSSRGSLMERSRDVSQTRGMKKLGLGNTTTTSPGPTKQSFEDVHSAYVRERKSDSDTANRFERDSGHTPQNLAATSWMSPDASDEADVSMDGDVESEAGSRPSLSKTEDGSIHPGLRAFRNARRQLQKQKEMESEETSPVEGRHGSRASNDRKPPPVYHSQREPSQDSWNNSGPQSRPESKASSRSDRDRSGSDTSNHGARNMQPTRHVPAPLQNMAAAGYGGRSTGSLRSPGLPAPLSAGLRMIRPGPAAPSSGSALGSTLSESLKKMVRKNDISEPTFLQSTNRVPTMSLPQSTSAPEVGRGATRPPSRPNVPAPPLPAMSPMRKQAAESRGARGFGNFMRRRTDNEKMDGAGTGAGAGVGSLAHSATTVGRPTRQYGSSSDEGENMAGRRLRKQHTEGSGMPSRKMGAGLPPSHMDLPGGMI